MIPTPLSKAHNLDLQYVVGATPACLEVGTALYAQAIDKVVQVSSTRVAEMAKLLENIHRAANIGLADERTLAAYDCAVLVTDHDAFDYELIAKHAKLLIDTRGRYRKPATNIVKA